MPSGQVPYGFKQTETSYMNIKPHQTSASQFGQPQQASASPFGQQKHRHLHHHFILLAGVEVLKKQKEKSIKIREITEKHQKNDEKLELENIKEKVENKWSNFLHLCTIKTPIYRRIMK